MPDRRCRWKRQTCTSRELKGLRRVLSYGLKCFDVCCRVSHCLRYSCSSRKPAESETAPSDENEDLQEMETKKKKPCEAEQLSKMKYPRFNLKKVRLKKGPEPF